MREDPFNAGFAVKMTLVILSSVDIEVKIGFKLRSIVIYLTNQVLGVDVIFSSVN